MIDEMHGNLLLEPYQPGTGAVFLIHLPVEKLK
jgi:hypothetical protein